MNKTRQYFYGFLLLVSFYGKSQTLQGKVTYTIDYDVNLPDRPDLELYQSMIPENIELSIKGLNSIMKINGGMAQELVGDILYKSAEKALYTISNTNKTAVKTPLSSLQQNGDKVFKAEKTNETSIFLGYKCTKYVVKDTAEKTETWVWSAPITNASSRLMVYFLESVTQYQIANVSGLPLKIEFKGKEFNLSILPKSIDKKTIPSSLFVIPKGYKVTQTP